jgi:hypothetical protein
MVARCAKAITVVAVLCVAAGPVLAGCSTNPRTAAPALDRAQPVCARPCPVTATDDTRAWVGYDAIAELTKVVGKRSGRGFGLLLLQGTDLFKEALNAPADTGIAPLDADDRTILLSWQCASATGT